MKVLSVVLAIAVWLVVSGYTTRTEGRTFRVPIVYRDIPEGWALDEPRPLDARVTLTGSERDFRFLDPAQLVLTIDVAELHPGAQRIRLAERELAHPRELVIDRIEPQQVQIDVRGPAAGNR